MEQIRRIERLHNLIRTRSTGTPAGLACKLEISESMCYLLIKFLKEKLNAPIYYSIADCSYCYEYDVEFVFGFFPVRSPVFMESGSGDLDFDPVRLKY